ncbi:MAG: hypothetical protein ACHQQS_11845 [Thermoanaerobaculales bacterium]
MTKRLVVGLATVFLALAGIATAQPAPSVGDAGSLSPEKILLLMKKAYASCRSYRDTGDVRKASVTEGGQFGSELPFATVFVRPDRLRFEFTDQGLGDRTAKYVVWAEGSEVRSWWDAKPGVRRPASLQAALDAAAGISGGSSVRVPGLLLPGVVGESAPLLGAERSEDGNDRGVSCFRIRGASRKTPYTLSMGARQITVKDESVTLWIDRATFLLRKVEQNRTFDTYREESTTLYTPEVNPNIAPGELVFGMPGTP